MAKLRINRFYYDPLPSNLKIEKSLIHGHGIFAKFEINKGVDLGSTHIKMPMIFGYVRTQKIKKNSEILLNYEN